MNTAATTQAPTRRLQVVLVVLAVAMSLVLSSALAMVYWQARRAAEFVTLGQAEARLQGVFDTLWVMRGQFTNDLLAQIITRQGEPGLRYVAIEREDGEVEASAGEALDHSPAPLSARHPIRVGNRIRLARPLEPRGPPPPHEGGPWEGRPPPFGGSPPGRPPSEFGPRGDRPPPRPPYVVIEFEPQLIDQFEGGAKITLLIGIVTLFGLLGGCIALIRILRHRDELLLRLERERHLSSLGEVSAVLAHEIRNPLASLKGHAQLLAETLPPESRESAKATRVVNEAVRLEQLTSDLLAFVRSGKIERRAVSPVKLLQESVALVDGERIRLHTDHAPGQWRLDPDRMQQVLVNVLANAVQASAEGGMVDATVTQDGRRLVFSVRDTGTGIAAEDAGRLFEPFFTKKTRGTGLGLAIARRIVEAHGGQITAANHPQGGAVFEIALPEVE